MSGECAEGEEEDGGEAKVPPPEEDTPTEAWAMMSVAKGA